MKPPILLLSAFLLLHFSGSVQADDSDGTAKLGIAGSTLDIVFAPGELDLPQSKVLDWISRSAHAVAGYYGRFPVRHAQITIIPVAGSCVQSGKSFGYLRASENISRPLRNRNGPE